MGIEDDIALLERVPAFATLGHEALRILAVGAESRSVAEGQVLFRAGDVADSSYIVETGSFRLIPSHPRERPIVVRRGTLLGEYALLTETRRPVTATAQELSSVMRITRPLFLRMLEGYPAVALRMRDGIVSRAGKMATEFDRVRTVLGDPPPLADTAVAAAEPEAVATDPTAEQGEPPTHGTDHPEGEGAPAAETGHPDGNVMPEPEPAPEPQDAPAPPSDRPAQAVADPADTTTPHEAEEKSAAGRGEPHGA